MTSADPLFVPPSDMFDVYLLDPVDVDGTVTWNKGRRVASAAELPNAVTLMASWYAAMQQPQTYNQNLTLAAFETATDTPKAHISG